MKLAELLLLLADDDAPPAAIIHGTLTDASGNPLADVAGDHLVPAGGADD